MTIAPASGGGETRDIAVAPKPRSSHEVRLNLFLGDDVPPTEFSMHSELLDVMNWAAAIGAESPSPPDGFRISFRFVIWALFRAPGSWSDWLRTALPPP